MNERQEFILYKARMMYENKRQEQNNWCDEAKTQNSSMKSWGEKLDTLNGQLATEAVEYIKVLQEAYDRRGEEIDTLKYQVQSRPGGPANYPQSAANYSHTGAMDQVTSPSLSSRPGTML